MLRPGQLLFTYLHLAPDPELTQRPLRVRRHLHRLRDGRGRARPPAAAGADERDRRQDRHPGRRLHAREAARRPRHPARRRARRRRRQRDGDRRRRGRHERRLHRDRDGGRRLRLRQVDRPPARARDSLRRALLDRLLDHAGDRGDAAARRPGDRRRPRPRRPRPLRRAPRAAGADEARRGAGRRRDRPGRLLRDLAADHPPATRPSRSTGSSTTASPTCPARCRSPRPTRSPTRPCPTRSPSPTTASPSAIRRDPGLRPGVNVAGGQGHPPGGRRRRRHDLRPGRGGPGPANPRRRAAKSTHRSTFRPVGPRCGGR